MKKFTMAIVAGLMMTGAAVPALALGPLDIDAELGVYSSYVWRGLVVTDAAVLQPELVLNVLGFGLGVWGNVDLTDANELEWKFNELRYTLSYDLPMPMFNLGAGFIMYDYPELGDANTTEFYIYAGANVILSPRLELYQDIDRTKGAYWDASVSHGFEMGESASLDFGAHLGLGSKSYIEGYFPVDPSLPWVPDYSIDATSTDFLIDAKLPFHPIMFIKVTPGVAYSTLLGDPKNSVEEADGAVYHGKTDAVIWSLSASFSF